MILIWSEVNLFFVQGLTMKNVETITFIREEVCERILVS